MSEQNDLDAPFDEWGDTLPSRRPKMSEQQDILHCPFCGSEAKAYASHYANLGEHWVICLSPNCGGKTHWWASRDQAIAAWNQRAGCASCRDEAIAAALAVEQKCYDQAQEIKALRALREACLGEWIRYESGYDRGQTRNDAAIAAALLACDEASAPTGDEHIIMAGDLPPKEESSS